MLELAVPHSRLHKPCLRYRQFLIRADFLHLREPAIHAHSADVLVWAHLVIFRDALRLVFIHQIFPARICAGGQQLKWPAAAVGCINLISVDAGNGFPVEHILVVSVPHPILPEPDFQRRKILPHLRIAAVSPDAVYHAVGADFIVCYR